MFSEVLNNHIYITHFENKPVLKKKNCLRALKQGNEDHRLVFMVLQYIGYYCRVWPGRLISIKSTERRTLKSTARTQTSTTRTLIYQNMDIIKHNMNTNKKKTQLKYQNEQLEQWLCFGNKQRSWVTIDFLKIIIINCKFLAACDVEFSSWFYNDWSNTEISHRKLFQPKLRWIDDIIMMVS